MRRVPSDFEIGTMRAVVARALIDVDLHDAVLKTYRASEMSLAHRFAVYLERDPLLAGWSIDCEYNRVGTDETVKRLAATKPTGSTRVDVVVHLRGNKTAEGNLLAIECKMSDSRQGARAADRKRVRELLSTYRYRFGTVITFGASGDVPSVFDLWERVGDAASLGAAPGDEPGALKHRRPRA